MWCGFIPEKNTTEEWLDAKLTVLTSVMWVLSPRTWSKFKSTPASPNQTLIWTPTRIAQLCLYWHSKMVHWCHLCNWSRNVVKTKVQRIHIYIYTHTTNQTLPPSICILSLIQEFRLLLFSMQLWVTVAVLGLLVMGSWAQGVMPTFSFPPCDSPEAEAAALVAQDFLNAQHTHGYKYALNQIEKIKILSQVRQWMIMIHWAFLRIRDLCSSMIFSEMFNINIYLSHAWDVNIINPHILFQVSIGF